MKFILKIIAYIIFLLLLAGLTFIITMWVMLLLNGPRITSGIIV